MLGNKWKILGEPRKTLDILFGLLQRTKGIPEVYEEIGELYRGYGLTSKNVGVGFTNDTKVQKYLERLQLKHFKCENNGIPKNLT